MDSGAIVTASLALLPPAAPPPRACAPRRPLHATRALPSGMVAAALQRATRGTSGEPTRHAHKAHTKHRPTPGTQKEVVGNGPV